MHHPLSLSWACFDCCIGTCLSRHCRWLDSAPAPSSATYVHWGISMPGGVKEPNNASPRRDENCGAANNSLSFDSPSAWGWADNQCNASLPFMCKMQPPSSSFAFVYPITGSTYILNTSILTFTEAQYTCNQQGGHLVSYNRWVWAPGLDTPCKNSTH